MAFKETAKFTIRPSSDNIQFNYNLQWLVRDIDNNQKAIFSIFAQAVSAVNEYPQEKRQTDSHFQPFIFLTEPNGKGFLFGRIIGSWNSDFTVYSIDEIDLMNHYDKIHNRGIQDKIIDLRHQGYPFVASESFISAAKNVDKLNKDFTNNSHS